MLKGKISSLVRSLWKACDFAMAFPVGISPQLVAPWRKSAYWWITRWLFARFSTRFSRQSSTASDRPILWSNTQSFPPFPQDLLL